ncbi:MAG: isochorismatase family protein [Desulfovermiculus sp.]|nr:isochorismatase family protein [Desulfovermiculus sp.]
MQPNQDLAPHDALLVVDVQNDFCPEGALPIPEGDAVVPAINPWIQAAADQNLLLLFSRDFHPLLHPSFIPQGGQWPVHCVQDTWGARFHPELLMPDSGIVVTKGVRFDQDQNSAFDQTGLDHLLSKQQVSTLWVAGLALDVCVQATVLDALDLGFNVKLLVQATRAVSVDSGKAALQSMQQSGAELIF